MDNFSWKLEIIKKKRTSRNFEQDNKMINIKNSVDGFNSKFKMVEEWLSQMEDS